jgi:hypothetical protein
MKKTKLINLPLLISSILMATLSGISTLFSQVNNRSVNLLMNPFFEFHSFVNHRNGVPVSYSSHNAAFWNTDSWGDMEVIRESHVRPDIRPDFTTHNMVAICPGKRIWQFFTLPEAGLAHGMKLNLRVSGYQKPGGCIRAGIKLMKLDSEDGEWSPRDYGMKDSRTFPRHSRGELVVAREYSVSDQRSGRVSLVIKKAEIIGKTSSENKSSSADINTIGIQVEFENTGLTDTVWIYSPGLTVADRAEASVPESHKMVPYYSQIPRTMQKLWKGETLHIIVMGSSIDRGSANPPMYLFDEDPSSKTFKQPLAEGLFDAVKAGRPDLDGYFGEWRHYFSYAGRLKLELMRKFNLTPDRICLNFMACDGSSVGESHSGLKEYCNLSIKPDPNLNGHARGKTWQELYPGLFTRPEGTAPDLVIFGSGANEKTDTPDEVAVFEGAIRWIQSHYPNTEFLFCQFQNKGGYTPNPGDMQALSLRYQIPYIDYGKAGDEVTRWCNRYALVPSDGHPQAACHYLWFRQIEKAFECWDPVVAGQVQLQLPERIHRNTYGWEGDMISFDTCSARIKINRFIFEDMAVNCWGKTDSEPPVPYVDGIKLESRRSSPVRDIRNSMFRYGRCTLGDRHILEITGKNAILTYVDSKINPGRLYFPVDNPGWNIETTRIEDFHSEWGAPYGTKKVILQPGESAGIEVICTDISVAYADKPEGGIIDVYIDNDYKVSIPSDIPFIDTDKNENYIENRKGITDLGYGLHKINIVAKNDTVTLLGIFTYDSRSNQSRERTIYGMAKGGETVEFSMPFRARPVVICTGGLSVRSEDIARNKVKFSGSPGSYQVTGE